MVDGFGPQERGEARAEKHGPRTLDEHLVEPLGHTIRLGGVMDVQVTNGPDVLKVSVKFLAQKFPSSVAP